MSDRCFLADGTVSGRCVHAKAYPLVLQEIDQALGISHETTRKHITRIIDKLGTRNHDKLGTRNHDKLGTRNHDKLGTRNHDKLGTRNHTHAVIISKHAAISGDSQPKVS
jgi:hypothetical protein